MKKFIKTFAASRHLIVTVKQDTDSRTFRVLQWDADDVAPKEIQQFQYKSRETARPGDVLMHEAQEQAIRFAAQRFATGNAERRSKVAAR
jgi:spore germination protein YaaH